MFIARLRTFSMLALLSLAAAAGAPAFARPQSSAPSNSTAAPTPAPKKPPVHAKSQTVTVTAKFTPEEKEDGELNELTATFHGPIGDEHCPQVLDTYPTGLIPAAEKAQFPKNKAKYLFLAHRAMADCQMPQGRYIEAEQSYRDAAAQADVWPGKDDSSYPAIWRDLGVAQMARNHWKDAEENLTKADALYQAGIESQIKAADVAAKEAGAEIAAQGPKLQAEVERPAREEAQKAVERAEQRRAEALAMLGVCYTRDGDLDNAAKTIDKAYQFAADGKLEGGMRDMILGVGAHVAELRGDAGDVAKWAARADTSAPPKGSQSQ
jgi:tetratricopeptide (TPR) repeat protein